MVVVNIITNPSASPELRGFFFLLLMTNKQGYILLSRSMLTHKSYLTEKFCKQMAWIDLIFLANWKKSSYHIRGVRVAVPRGSVAWSLNALADRWSWSKGKVIRFLSDLETEQQIRLQKSNIINLISITNYNKYQLGDTTDGTTNGSTDRTTDRSTDGSHQKELNKVNKERGTFFNKNGARSINSESAPLAVRQSDGTFKILKP